MLCSSLIWLSSPRLGGHLLARDASLYCPGRVVVCTNLPSFLIQSVQSTILKKNPLSPLLFVLCIEAHNSLIRLAHTRNLFTPLRSPAIKYRFSLYATDLVAFVTPVVKDVMLVRALLDMFAAGSGLQTNI
jgi:hypothetical protein